MIILQRPDCHPLPTQQLHHRDGDHSAGVRAQHPHPRLHQTLSVHSSRFPRKRSLHAAHLQLLALVEQDSSSCDSCTYSLSRSCWAAWDSWILWKKGIMEIQWSGIVQSFCCKIWELISCGWLEMLCANLEEQYMRLMVLWCFVHACFVQVTILKLVWGSRRADAPRCAHFSTDICSVIQEIEVTVEKCVHRGTSRCKERHTLSLGRNKHGHNNSAPLKHAGTPDWRHTASRVVL